MVACKGGELLQSFNKAQPSFQVSCKYNKKGHLLQEKIDYFFI